MFELFELFELFATNVALILLSHLSIVAHVNDLEQVLSTTVVNPEERFMTIVVQVILSGCLGEISNGTDGKAVHTVRYSLGRASTWFTNAGWASIREARYLGARTGVPSLVLVV